MQRVQELCRKLRPVLGKKIDRLWSVYLAESEPSGKADLEQTLELLAAKHLGQNFEPDRSPFPPPSKDFAKSGEIHLGKISYGNKALYPFFLKSDRLKEHLLIAGRSGSGKTNLTFVLMKGIMARGIKVLALDWKRGYRDLLTCQDDLRIYTIGRDISPFRFNPLIPPPGCEPNVWIKLIVDVIASAYLGGEGVISLLVAGIDHLYREAGVFDKLNTTWPTIPELLIWLKTTKLKGRAAMWQASAERILLAMTYGEFGSVVNTTDNSHVRDLLNHNVILEMDGLSSNSDKKMFSEALTLYLYRYRLALGTQKKLTNLIILEEAHNLLLQKSADAKESVLENSIRMIRQYGLGYVFVDQSASLLSKVAFANSYATIALSQKLSSDIRAIASAMNLEEEQRHALSTLPIGTAVVRLADEFPEPFMVKVPKMTVDEGSVTDEMVKKHMGTFYTDSSQTKAQTTAFEAVSAVPAADKNKIIIAGTGKDNKESHPIAVQDTDNKKVAATYPETDPPLNINPAIPKLSREEIRFLNDISAKPLSTTVVRYHRLNLSRRRGNAVRQNLNKAAIIEPVRIATRSGQVILYQLTEFGRLICNAAGIDPGPLRRPSLEHQYWIQQTSRHFQNKGFDTTIEYQVKNNGAVDILAERNQDRVAVEIETGKSNITQNIRKIQHADFNQIILIATNPDSITACKKAMEQAEPQTKIPVTLLTWLDIS